MRRVTLKQKWFKSVNLRRTDQVYVGLDVHKKSISVAIWRNGCIELTFTTSASYGRLVEQLGPLREVVKKVFYEAGPTGYGLARALERAHIPVEVIAPANTPRPSKRQSKTDGLDCRHLAEYGAKGLLKAVTIPTVQEEAERQLSRLRDQLVSKRRRVRQQIKSFLLQHGISEPAGLGHWTQAGVAELKKLVLGGALRFTLDMYLEELERLTMQVKRTEGQLEQLGRQKRHGASLEILLSHPGVGTITAWAFRLELYRPERFGKGTEIASFVGLSPRISQSGQTCRGGPIVKSGREQLRSKLIEAAWMWVHYDPGARRVYGRLYGNTGNANKAIVGMARRLAVRLWRMLCEQQRYRPAG